MNKISPVILVVITLLIIGACQEGVPVESTIETPETPSINKSQRGKSIGRIAVANRNSGTITVIDAATDQVEGTYTLPGNNPEPMYIVWSQTTNRVFVGDRANNTVVVYNGNDFSLAGTVPAGNGVFHMWADVKAVNQLWVNNDIDNTTTVINPLSLSVITTVPTPPDLVAMGGKPHDVLVSPEGNFAYVSVLGVEGENDYVVQYSTSTFQETGRAAVGKDPHLSATFANNFLYVPCQNSDAVFVLDRSSMALVKTIDADGAHGAGMQFDGDTFYTTNLPGGGSGGLISINTASNTVSSSQDTPVTIPHNIALAPNLKAAPGPRKLYITHSGATANEVSVFDVSGSTPVFLKTIEAGLNPFGIAFIR